MDPPHQLRLVRTLSTHHWISAAEDLCRTEKKVLQAGTARDSDGNITWKYYIVKNPDNHTGTMISQRGDEKFIQGVMELPAA